MTEATTLLIVAWAMALACASWLTWALMRAEAADLGMDASHANAEIYRSQQAELDQERRQGRMNALQHQQACDALSLRLLADTQGSPAAAPSQTPAKWTALGVMLAVPLVALAMYSHLGTPDINARIQAADQTPPDDASALRAVVQTLNAQLKQQPNNPQVWLMLGRSHRDLNEFDAALRAYAQVLRWDQSDDLQVERAEVIAASQGGRFQGEPWQLIREVLSRDPKHLGALLLGGSAAYAQHEWPLALSFWQRARAEVGDEHPDVPQLEGLMTQTRALMAGMSPMASALDAPVAAPAAAPTAPALAGGATPAAGPGAGVSGTVSLSAAARAAVRGEDTVFIYATAAEGGRMPVAILKTTVAELPMRFQLSDSLAMSPQFKLSDQAQVMVKARVSRSGTAMPQSGDWLATVGPVAVGAQDLALRIAERLP
jgi:cytochrome c-type biogenesis protein CcmH